MIPTLTFRSRIIAVCFIVFTAWLISLFCFIKNLPVLKMADPVPMDAVITLTGGSNRVKTGFELLGQGLGKKLFISGVYRGVDVQEIMTHMKKDVDSHWECCVALGFDADDTIGNARETAAWVKKENITTAYLVTSNYHMQRALLEFQRFAPQLNITPWPVEPEGHDLKSWWKNPATAGLLAREHAKYLVVRARYSLTGVL